MLLLALDTATPAVTVALHDGAHVLAEATAVDARRQAELLATVIGRVLAQAGVSLGEVSAVVGGVGPGPYTGLRTGLVTARVLGSALGVPVHGVCTLDVIALDAVRHAGGHEFLVATDARRRELYWARYSPQGRRLSGPHVGAPPALPAGLPTAGEGPHLYPAVPGAAIEPRYPSAATLARLAAGRLAGGAPLLAPQPLYLRRPDARTPGPPKRVTPPGAHPSGAPARIPPPAARGTGSPAARDTGSSRRAGPA